MIQHSAKILIIEDSLSSIALIRQVMLQEGHQILSASHAIEGLKLAENEAPELILLDVVMPDIDGFECCEQLKKNHITQDIPVIFISARTGHEFISKGFACGAADYITKPFHPKELITRVQNHIQLHRSQTLLIQQNKELNQALSARDKFYSHVAHDIKTPVGIQQSVITELLDPEVHENPKLRAEYLDILSKSSIRLTRLLDNLLSWAMNQTEGIQLDPAHLDLSLLVTDVVDLLRQAATKKTIEIQNLIPAQSFIFAEQQSVATVLRNLITNGIKFSPIASTLTISSQVQGELIEVKVQDEGMGIPETLQHKLFIQGEQFSTPGTDGELGTGLGLVLCKDFVEKNGGQISYQNHPEQGSIFCFTLPLGTKTEE